MIQSSTVAIYDRQKDTACLPATPRRLPAQQPDPMIGSSAKIKWVLHQIETVAYTDATVLIHGETGTGKELVARAIHDQGLRKNGPFVKLNCAAIPSGLLESELFGHERGAFTGAVAQTVGRFQFANGGTLFLDEIGDLPLELQPKLLRVLQEQEFERLGSNRTISVNVRVVAATNQELQQMVRDRRYRADLFYRLNVFPILLPPLRDRSEDVPALVEHFVEKCAKRMNKIIDVIPEDVMDILRSHDWPGNIRELHNFVERAVIMSAGRVLRPSLAELKSFARQTESLPSRTLAEAERAHILDVLHRTKWVISGSEGAAAKLGMARTTLIYRMRKLGIGRRDNSAIA